MIPNDRPRAHLRSAPIAALVALLLLPACSSTGGTQAGLSDSGSSAGEGDEAHKIAMAELALDQARLESEQEQAKAELELVTAERKLAQAKMELQVFKKSKELGALAQVHAENGHVIDQVG